MAGAVQRGAPVLLRGDAGLLQGFRDGDDTAFAELVRRHGPRMRRVCARIVGPDDAEDAVQQALLSASRALRAGAEVKDAGAWLHRVAHNASIDWLRRRPEDAEPLDESLDGVPQPPDVAAGRAELAATVAAIQQLPDAQRRALLLSVFEGRSWEEIARELGTKETAVRGLLHRARTGMRAGAALCLFPFFVLRARAARAADLLSHGGGLPTGAAKAGLTVVLAGAAAGGTAVVVHHAGRRDNARGSETLVASASPGGSPVTVLASTAAAPAVSPAHRLKVRRRHATGGHRAHRRQTAGGAGTPSTGAGTPGSGTKDSTTTRGHDSFGSPGSATLPPIDTHTKSTPTSPPATTPTTPSAPTSPASPPAAAAPVTTGRVDSFAPAGNGGTMHVIYDDGSSVTAFVGENTTVTCDTVSGGTLVSSAGCAPSNIAGGERVVRAEHAINASSGAPVFTAVEVVLPA